MVDEEGFTYDVNKPAYLHYNGSFCVCKDMHLSLLVWPCFAGKTKYGAMFTNKEQWYQIQITKDGEMLEVYGYKYTDDEKEAYESKKEDVLVLLQKANTVWELD